MAERCRCGSDNPEWCKEAGHLIPGPRHATQHDQRLSEGPRIHDGSVPFVAGCPRQRSDCTAMARVASPGYASFMCCGETDAAPVPTDVLRLCIYSSHDRKPVDLLVNLDRRDAIDVSSVLLAGMSSLAQADAANAFAITEKERAPIGEREAKDG